MKIQINDLEKLFKIIERKKNCLKKIFFGTVLEGGHIKRYWYLITTSGFSFLSTEVDETTVHLSEK